MEESPNHNPKPEEVEGVFTCKTQDRKTEEIGFIVAIMPESARSTEGFMAFIEEMTLSKGLIPVKFEVRVGDEVVAHGGVE